MAVPGQHEVHAARFKNAQCIMTHLGELCIGIEVERAFV